MPLVIERKRENKSIQRLTFKLCLIYWLYIALYKVVSYDGLCLWVKPVLDNEPQ